MPTKQKRKIHDEKPERNAQTTSTEDGGHQQHSPPEVEGKRTRPDRAAKRAKRSEESETVVKACLLRHIRGDGFEKVAMRDALLARVLSFSKRIRCASLGMTHLIKQLYNNDQDISTIQVPSKYFDQTFIRQLLLGTQGASVPDPDIASLHSQFPEYLNDSDRHQGDRNIYSAGATKYLTNMKNHMRVNLDRFMKRSIYALHPDLNGSQKYELMKRIKGLTGHYNEDDDNRDDDNEEEEESTEETPVAEDRLSAIVAAHRAALGLVRQTDRISEGWLKNNSCLPLILRYFVFLNREIESKATLLPLSDRPRLLKRLFDVVPLCNVKTHFITVDTSVLYGLMVELGYLKSSAYAAFDAMRQDQWMSVFKLRRLEGRYTKFTGTIETDGTAINVHFVRERLVSDSSTGEEFRVRPNDFVMSCDPGLKDICSMAIPLKMKDGARDVGMRDMKCKTFSRARYYRESGIIQARKHSTKWNQGVKAELDDLSRVSSRGANMASFRDYVAVHTMHRGALWGEYTKTRWARQRFRLYGGKKRSIDGFLNELEASCRDKTKRIVVAYGTGRAVAKRGCTPAPSTRMFREFQKRFLTVPTDEFRSTYTHCERGSVLAQVEKKRRPQTRMQRIVYGPQTRQQISRRSKIRGLLWCDSTSDGAREHFLNRDFNAAINIRKCLILPERPMNLRRSTFVGQPLVHRVGKTLRR